MSARARGRGRGRGWPRAGGARDRGDVGADLPDLENRRRAAADDMAEEGQRPSTINRRRRGGQRAGRFNRDVGYGRSTGRAEAVPGRSSKSGKSAALRGRTSTRGKGCAPRWSDRHPPAAVIYQHTAGRGVHARVTDLGERHGGRMLAGGGDLRLKSQTQLGETLPFKKAVAIPPVAQILQYTSSGGVQSPESEFR